MIHANEAPLPFFTAGVTVRLFPALTKYMSVSESSAITGARSSSTITSSLLQANSVVRAMIRDSFSNRFIVLNFIVRCAPDSFPHDTNEKSKVEKYDSDP